MNTKEIVDAIQRDPENNRVGVVALSMPSVKQRRRWVQDAIVALKRLGLCVELGRSVFGAVGYKSASAATRARDLQQMLQNPRVRIILNTTGGYNSNEILPRLNFARLAPVRDKLFVGYSDITAINLALYAKTKVQVIQGPMLVDCSQDANCYRRLFAELQAQKRELRPPTRVWEWDKPSSLAPQVKYLNGKRTGAEGPLVAGNVSTFNLMLGTPWMPSLDGAVLFLEYDKEEAQGLPSLERLLWQLRLAGCFERLSALVFGLLPQDVQREQTRTDSLQRILLEVTRGYRFPVLYDAAFGHLYPSWALPLGKRVQVQTRVRRCNLRLVTSS